MVALLGSFLLKSIVKKTKAPVNGLGQG